MATAEQTAPAEQETKKQEPARQLFRGPFKTIAAALVGAQLNAKAVAKDATNEWHKYKYASAESLIEEARSALNAAGLATIMERWEILPPLEGNEFQRIKIYFKTVHADSEQTLPGDVEYHIVPEKGRPDDKATATALTYAEGYYLRGLLCLPRVDPETDVDQRNDKGFDPSQRRQQDRPQNRGNQRQGNQRPSGQQGRQQQRPPQTANGNGKPPAQQNGQPTGQSNDAAQAKTQTANGHTGGQPSGQSAAPNAPPAGKQSPPPAANSQAAAPQGSERYRWWAGKIVGAPDTNQLTGMTAAIGKDMKLDDAEKKLLADMASNEARRREQAQERAGDPPVGRPRDEAAQA